MAVLKAIRKSGVLSPWRNPFDPCDKFYRRVSVITRAILNFNGTQSVDLSENRTLTDNSEIEFLVYPTNVFGSEEILVGNYVNPRGFIRIKQRRIETNFTDAGGETVFSGLPVLENNKIQRIRIRRLGNDVTVSYAGQSQTIEHTEFTTVSFDMLAGKGNDRRLNGCLFSAKFWDGGDRFSGQLVGDYRIDEPDTIYQQNYASAITDPSDPSWSGASLENVLPGDWEEISQESGQTDWLGTTELRRSDEGVYTNTPSTYDASLGVIHMARNADGTGGVDFSENLTAGYTYRFYTKYKDYFGPAPDITQINLGLYRAFSATNLVPVQPFPAATEYEEISYIGTAASDSSLSAICGGSSRGISLKDFSVRRILQYAEGAL